MKPQRKCIGCNQSMDKDMLKRFVLVGDELIEDKEQNLPGRGCYLCNNQKCIDNAIKRKAFGRALRKTISNESLGRCLNDR